MKIRTEEIDGEPRIVTPCKECIFYDPTYECCNFGRIEKYKAKGKTRGGDGTPYEILTFCNHARPREWQKEGEQHLYAQQRAMEDNRIRYDLILRISEPEQVEVARELLNRRIPPQRIIFSFTKIDIAEVVERANELSCDFELIKIQDEKARTESELRRVQYAWSETVDADKNWSLSLMDEFNSLINDDLEQIVAVVGDQYIIMTMLVASLEVAQINFSFDNIKEIANMQQTTENIRSFDGKRICDYSEPQLQ